MANFSVKSFERLFFKLHGNVYRSIENEFSEILRKQRFSIEHLCELYRPVSTLPTDIEFPMTNKQIKRDIQRFDLRVDVYLTEIKQNIKKAGRCRVFTDYHQYSNGMTHFILRIHNKEGTYSAYIAPLQLLCKQFESTVCRDGTYQVYEHTLLNKKSVDVADSTSSYLIGAHRYIGITKRSWNVRYREHMNAVRRGSHLRFHRALRGEFFQLGLVEHQVLRAGIGEKDAFIIEESEVERRSLYQDHPHGLNMIPGGEAGIRYLSKMKGLKSAQIDPEKKVLDLENHINSCLSTVLSKSRTREEKLQFNKKIISLWKDDINFRIKAMTNSSKRLSYDQIMYIRIRYASGWSLDKIRENIPERSDSFPSIDQIKRLVDNKTYSTIPHVLLDVN